MRRKQKVGIASMWIGSFLIIIFSLSLTVVFLESGLSETTFTVFTLITSPCVVLVVFGFIIYRHYAAQFEQFKIEYLKDGTIQNFEVAEVEKMKANKDIDGLIKAFTDEYTWWLRAGAEEALVQIGSPAVDSLIRALKYEKNAGSRIAQVLGKIGDIRAVEPLIEALKSEDSDVAYSALIGLVEIGDVRAIEPLIEALKSENSDAVDSAIWGLVKIGDVRAIKPIIEAANNEDPEVSQTIPLALEELAEKLGKPVFDALIEALKGENPYTREVAENALGFARDSNAIELLIEALKDKYGRIRSEAASNLGVTEDRRAVEPLIEALKDEDPQVRFKVAWALGRMGDQRAVEPLIEALKDKDSSVRSCAAFSLGAIGDKRAVEALKKALKGRDKEVEWSAKKALKILSKHRK